MTTEFYFTSTDNCVMLDYDFSPTEKLVYWAVSKHINLKTKICRIYLKTIAKEISRSVRTVQRALKKLLEKGVILIKNCFAKDGRQTASQYTVMGREAKCYENDTLPPVKNDTLVNDKENKVHDNSENKIVSNPHDKNVTLPHDKNVTPINYNNNNNYIKRLPNREVETSVNLDLKNELENIKPEIKNPEPENFSLNDVPSVMKETAELFLLKTGRKSFSLDEISAMKKLLVIHYPARIQKEISKTVERFIKKGRSLATVTFSYIYEALKNQRSFKNFKNFKNQEIKKENQHNLNFELDKQPQITYSQSDLERIEAEFYSRQEA